MASTEIEICNMALSHLGVGKEIADLANEKSDEARACRRMYGPSRDATLRDFPWPFATKYAQLGLVKDDPEETDEWDYSYQYPSDCAKIIRLTTDTSLTQLRNESRQARIPFKIARGTSGKLIYTDEEDAGVEYVVLETDPARFDPDFVVALSFRLAMMIAPRVAGGDQFKLGPRAGQLYGVEISRAWATAINEGQVDEEVMSEFIRARE